MFYHHKTFSILLGILSLLAIVLGGIVYFLAREQTLKVIFLDVGQGDAILITEGSNQVLIDGGRSGKKLLSQVGRFVPFWDRKIETVIATHPDQDHIGGLIDLVSSYGVDTFFVTDATSDTETFAAWQNAIAQNGGEKISVHYGYVVQYPSGAKLRIIYPFGLVDNKTQKETNKYGIATILTAFDKSFLFTADLDAAQEEQLPVQNIGVLKVGHHGSKYSTSDIFLEKIMPQDAIVSVGKENPYGHPAGSVLLRLHQHNARVFRTDEQGNIIYACRKNQEKCDVSFD